MVGVCGLCVCVRAVCMCANRSLAACCRRANDRKTECERKTCVLSRSLSLAPELPRSASLPPPLPPPPVPHAARHPYRGACPRRLPRGTCCVGGAEKSARPRTKTASGGPLPPSSAAHASFRPTPPPEPGLAGACVCGERVGGWNASWQLSGPGVCSRVVFDLRRRLAPAPALSGRRLAPCWTPRCNEGLQPPLGPRERGWPRRLLTAAAPSLCDQEMEAPPAGATQFFWGPRSPPRHRFCRLCAPPGLLGWHACVPGRGRRGARRRGQTAGRPERAEPRAPPPKNEPPSMRPPLDAPSPPTPPHPPLPTGRLRPPRRPRPPRRRRRQAGGDHQRGHRGARPG